MHTCVHADLTVSVFSTVSPGYAVRRCGLSSGLPHQFGNEMLPWSGWLRRQGPGEHSGNIQQAQLGTVRNPENPKRIQVKLI